MENCVIYLEEIGIEKRNILSVAIIRYSYIFYLNYLVSVAIYSGLV